MSCLKRWDCSAEPDRLSVRSYILPFQALAGYDRFGLKAADQRQGLEVSFGS